MEHPSRLELLVCLGDLRLLLQDSRSDPRGGFDHLSRDLADFNDFWHDGSDSRPKQIQAKKMSEFVLEVRLTTYTTA